MSDGEKVVRQRGLWFEELEEGVRYVHAPGRTITEADNVLFTTVTMNTQALHLDAAWSDEQPPFNQRLVNSMFTLATLVGLSVTQMTQGTTVGNLGFSDIAFPKPMFHGDTLGLKHVLERVREVLPGAEVCALRGVGHYPQLEAPEEVAKRALAARRVPTARRHRESLPVTWPQERSLENTQRDTRRNNRSVRRRAWLHRNAAQWPAAVRH